MRVTTSDDHDLFRIPLGVAEDADQVEWDFRFAPLIVAGKSNSGRTVVINGVGMEAAARGWQVWIIDTLGVEFLGLRGYPNVQLIATTVLDMMVLIYQAEQEMDRRYALIETGEVVEADLEPLLVMLDEYRDFYASVTEWYAGIKVSGMLAQCPVVEKLSSISRKGRSARIHLIVGTQRPDAALGAMMMWEAPHIGVDVPRIALALSRLRGWLLRRRAPRRAPGLCTLGQLRPAQSLHPPLQVWMDQELLEEVDEKGRSQEWEAVQRAELRPAQDDGSSS